MDTDSLKVSARMFPVVVEKPLPGGEPRVALEGVRVQRDLVEISWKLETAAIFPTRAQVSC